MKICFNLVDKLMASTVPVFRALLLFGVMLYGALLLLPFFDEVLLKQEEKNALSYVGVGAMLELSDPILWGIAAAWFVCMFGMWRFCEWGRAMFVVWVVATALLTLFSGVTVRTPTEEFLASVGNVVDGAILAISYHPQVQRRFCQRKQEQYL